MENVTLEDLSGTPLAGAGLGSPLPGTESATHAFKLSGWVVGLEEFVDSVKVRSVNGDLATLPTGVERYDVAEHLDVGVAAERSGFGGTVGVVGAPFPDAELVLQACIGDVRVPFARIEIERERLGSPGTGLQPLAMVTLGRSGSMWLAQLLAEHPDIVVYRPFVTEPKLTRYWLDILRALGAPASYIEALGPRFGSDTWWLGHPELGWGPDVPDSDVRDWLEGDAVDALADLCRSRVDAFYSHVREVVDKPGARYFAEKVDPLFTASLLQELYADPLEVFLVRDPRDQLASMRAFNRAGRGQFGPDTEDVDVQGEWFAAHLNGLTTRWLARREHGAALLRYEDIVREPAGVLQRLFSVLGLDDDSALVEAMVRNARGRDRELQAGHATAASAEASMERWRSDFPDGELERVEAWLGDALDVLGYRRAAAELS